MTPHPSPIMVTQSTLPPLEEYVGYLKRIWGNHWLTNNGPLVLELEQKLRDYLGCPDLWFVNNGTTALQLSLKALDLRGEIITTPFSYVATTGVVLWENCTPVFVDVRPSDLTIDPERVEAAISPATTAILATHVYGFPCAVDELERIARKHGLKIIYDAAHSFGCRLGGRHLANYGDISCLSFHATKVFHTVEGGAVIINSNSALSERVRLMRAFGHFGDDHHNMGINGKNSEFHAAMGLCNLPRLSTALAVRRRQHENYQRLLAGSPVQTPQTSAHDFEYNYAYFPVLLPSEHALLQGLSKLARSKIHPRRYFYPSLNRLPYLQGPVQTCPMSERAAKSVLCLPMSELITPELQEQIVSTLIESSRA